MGGSGVVDPVASEAGASTESSELTARQIAGSRVEIDPYIRDVMCARVRSALFGAATTVKVGRYELRKEIGSGGGGAVFVAWDPELTREVALKLIVAANPELRARALAEGQALARLSHPNVVSVFDVGVVDERLYLVMELVDGTSLRSYAASTRPREIIAAYRQCAAGLAAAHAARLVHRDFKPDNAVIGGDGRVRVIDFGLAISDGAAARRGGTPRYMSPEQRRGEPLTAATDQYALAASLREALAPLPRWLEATIARALAPDPAARFGSMRELEAALGRDPVTRWRRRALLAVPVVVAVAGYGLGQAREGPPPCSGGASEIAATWSPVQRDALAAHLDALGAPYARVAAGRLSAEIDRYAARWIASHRASCLVHLRGELTAERYDRRQVCLASGRDQLRSLVELGSAVPADQVASVVAAVPELPDPARCADVDATTIAPPAPGQAHQVAQLRKRLDQLRVQVQAEAPDALTALDAVIREAEVLGYAPVLAAAQLMRGTALLLSNDHAAAEAPLAAASTLAFRARDYAVAVEAFARRAWILSKLNARVEEVLAGVEQVLPLVEGLPRHARFAEALLHNNLGSIWIANDHPDRAREALQRAVTLAREVEGPGAVELVSATLNLALVTDDPVRRAELCRSATSARQARLGGDHPATLRAHTMCALMQQDGPAARQAIAQSCSRLVYLHPTRTYQISECSFPRGWLELAYGDRTEARRSFARVSMPELRALAEVYLAILDGELARATELLQPLRRGEPAPGARWYELRNAAEPAFVAAELARAQRRPAQQAAELDAGIRYLSMAMKIPAAGSVRLRLAWALAERAALDAR
jgi:eukaryotic-like serine/threonine-protein kinase